MTALCRHCATPLTHVACDLGEQPLANNLVPQPPPDTADPRYPLRVMVCDACLLVQLEQTVDPTLLFGTYSYLSSVSTTWLAHAARFAAWATDRFALNANNLVIEIGSNDGYLLREFLARGIPCLGIEPAANVAEQARGQGVPTHTAFFGEQVACQLARADLLVANNVLAHAPSLMDFVRGLALVLAPGGVLSIEVPHVLAMLRGEQFDTIYHEHVCYFSALALQRVLAAAGLSVFDIESLPTHGGSIRVLAQHVATGRHAVAPSVADVIAEERAAGLADPDRYAILGTASQRVAGGLRAFLDQARAEGATVAAYGAAAKGTMLLNAAGATPRDVQFVADANPLKQNHCMPGCRIPVVPPSCIQSARPDFLLILPWNIAPEIAEATRFIADWGGRHVVPSPRLRILPA